MGVHRKWWNQTTTAVSRCRVWFIQSSSPVVITMTFTSHKRGLCYFHQAILTKTPRCPWEVSGARSAKSRDLSVQLAPVGQWKWIGLKRVSRTNIRMNKISKTGVCAVTCPQCLYPGSFPQPRIPIFSRAHGKTRFLFSRMNIHKHDHCTERSVLVWQGPLPLAGMFLDWFDSTSQDNGVSGVII